MTARPSEVVLAGKATPAAEPTRAERDVAFGKALEALRSEIEADLGERDIVAVKRVMRLSRGAELFGRVLIQWSVEPVGFSLGVAALGLHKQLEAISIGHMVLHGVYDRLDVPDQLRSKTHAWRCPVSEEAWRYNHNVLHHSFSGVIGKDPDATWTLWRTVDSIEHRPWHWLQVPTLLGVMVPNLWSAVNWHITGVAACYGGDAAALPHRNATSMLRAHRLALSKTLRYVAKEYGFWPALAGPFFPKVMLGNFLAGTLRDLWSGAVIMSSHAGDDVKAYDDFERPRSRGEYCRQQVETTRNLPLGRLASFISGGMDLQIEHHLFPRLPVNRLREMAPRVRAICEEHGVSYTLAPIGKALLSTLKSYARLSVPNKGAPRS